MVYWDLSLLSSPKSNLGHSQLDSFNDTYNKPTRLSAELIFIMYCPVSFPLLIFSMFAKVLHIREKRLIFFENL